MKEKRYKYISNEDLQEVLAAKAGIGHNDYETRIPKKIHPKWKYAARNHFYHEKERKLRKDGVPRRVPKTSSSGRELKVRDSDGKLQREVKFTEEEVTECLEDMLKPSKHETIQSWIYNPDDEEYMVTIEYEEGGALVQKDSEKSIELDKQGALVLLGLSIPVWLIVLVIVF